MSRGGPDTWVAVGRRAAGAPNRTSPALRPLPLSDHERYLAQHWCQSASCPDLTLRGRLELVHSSASMRRGLSPDFRLTCSRDQASGEV